MNVKELGSKRDKNHILELISPVTLYKLWASLSIIGIQFEKMLIQCSKEL